MNHPLQKISPLARHGLAALLWVSLWLAAAVANAMPRVIFTVEDGEGNTVIAGESAEPAFRGWIDAISIGTGFDKLPVGAEFAARRARLVVPDFFVVTKQPDKASPKLQEAFFREVVFPVVRLKYLTEGLVSPAQPITIELRGVSVVEYEMGNGLFDPTNPKAPPGGIPTELFGLAFDEIRWLYRYDDPDTGRPATETSRWDRSYGTNSPDEDSDGDGIPNSEDPDDDNDGATDGQELENMLNPFVNDLLFDFDRDDQPNFRELLTGTDLNSGRSRFAIESLGLRKHPDGMALSLRLPVIGGRIYRVFGSFNPGDPEGWILLREFPIEPGRPFEMADFELPPGVAQRLPQMYFRATVEYLE